RIRRFQSLRARAFECVSRSAVRCPRSPGSSGRPTKEGRFMRARVAGLVAAVALIAGSVAAVTTLPAGANNANHDDHEQARSESERNDANHDDNAKAANEIEFHLVPSTPAIAKCFPHLEARVEVKLQTAQRGRDVFQIDASGLPAHQDFTVFLLQIPGS